VIGFFFFKWILFSEHMALFFIYSRSIILSSTIMGKISIGVCIVKCQCYFLSCN